jgi:hypothetical protein
LNVELWLEVDSWRNCWTNSDSLHIWRNFLFSVSCFLKPVFRCVDRGLMVSLVGPYSSVPGACARQFQWKYINKGFPHWLLFKEILHAHGFHWKWTMQEPQPHGGDCGVSIEINWNSLKLVKKKKLIGYTEITR